MYFKIDNSQIPFHKVVVKFLLVYPINGILTAQFWGSMGTFRRILQWRSPGRKAPKNELNGPFLIEPPLERGYFQNGQPIPLFKCERNGWCLFAYSYQTLAAQGWLPEKGLQWHCLLKATNCASTPLTCMNPLYPHKKSHQVSLQRRNLSSKAMRPICLAWKPVMKLSRGWDQCVAAVSFINSYATLPLSNVKHSNFF